MLINFHKHFKLQTDVEMWSLELKKLWETKTDRLAHPYIQPSGLTAFILGWLGCIISFCHRSRLHLNQFLPKSNEWSLPFLWSRLLPTTTCCPSLLQKPSSKKSCKDEKSLRLRQTSCDCYLQLASGDEPPEGLQIDWDFNSPLEDFDDVLSDPSNGVLK